MALANYAASGLGEKTAYLEIHEHGEISYWKNTNADGYFMDYNVHYYPNLRKEQIPILLNYAYDKIIMDFGDAYSHFREELLWCDKKVFLLNLNPWKVFAAKKMVNAIRKEEWGEVQPTYASIHAQKAIKKAIEKECRIQITEIPFITDPRFIREEEFSFMDFILGFSAAKEKQRKSPLPIRRRK